MRQKVAGVAVTKQTDEEVQYPGSSWAKEKQVLTSWAEQRRQREAGSFFTVINQRGDERLLTHLYHSVANQTELQVDENHSKHSNLPLIYMHHVWSPHLEFILEAILERLQLSCEDAAIVPTVFSAHTSKKTHWQPKEDKSCWWCVYILMSHICSQGGYVSGHKHTACSAYTVPLWENLQCLTSQ